MTVILDGKRLRDKLLAGLKTEIDKCKIRPSLAVILVGEDPASKIYVNNKKKTAEKLGINSLVINYPEDVTEEILLKKIDSLNCDESIHAILVQLPLPKHINKQRVISAILPSKDVDCFTMYNCGCLASGIEPYVYPCTPSGILLLLDEYNIDLAGKHVVVVGRSNLVGKPFALMALKRNATITICHSYTQNICDITKTADILVSAVGKPVITNDMIKKNCVVIDVGIFRNDNGKIRGDVDYEEVSKTTSYISPVPGGVGPMTITSLMLNTFELYKKQISNH